MPRGWTATSWCRTELLTCQIGLLTQLDPDVAIRGVKQFSISRKIKNLRPVGRMSRRVEDSCSVAWSLAVEYRDGTTPYHSRTCGSDWGQSCCRIRARATPRSEITASPSGPWDRSSVHQVHLRGIGRRIVYYLAVGIALTGTGCRPPTQCIGLRNSSISRSTPNAKFAVSVGGCEACWKIDRNLEQ